MTTEVDPAFEQLLEHIRDSRGFDFTGYKRASLMRRVHKRMHEVDIEAFSDYQDYLEVHPEEFNSLFNTILINVTSFFRDPESWKFLAEEVVPRIVEQTSGRGPMRVWSVGCASGEEAYTLAMTIAEAVGPDELRAGVKIYATDVDEEALEQARAGVYSATAVESIPPELREKYLVPSNDGFVFRQELRRTVIFGRHDLVHDAPISRVNLIVCRNTLIYFNAETQTRIYNGYHFALRPDGYLFLGKSEMLLTRTDIFEPVDLRRRVFSRVTVSRDRAVWAPPHDGGFSLESARERLRAGVFESAMISQVALDASGTLVAANGQARTRFCLGDSDIGRPFHELELSYKPIELRSRIDRASSEQRSNVELAVSWAAGDGRKLFLDVEVIPIFANGDRLGTSITFTDVTRPYEMTSALEGSQNELEEAYEQIQSTVEELETTNEELQSTNEELETTNEELQSTNEELETMNEELYSTNAEFETVNDELRVRTGQLNQANSFFESVMESMRAGIVVLGRDLTVESWNLLAEDMWGLRADEVRGKNLFTLDFGLPVDQLQHAIRNCLSGVSESVEVTVDATNRRGREIRCRVVCSQMMDQSGHVHGVILLLEAVEI